MWRKETRRCWDSLARCKRWSDMRETMLRRVRSANMTAYRLGTSQLGLYPTHSTQIHYSVLHRIIFQRTYGFMPALEEYCLRVYFIFGHSDVKRDLKKLPQQMQKENGKLALLHTPKKLFAKRPNILAMHSEIIQHKNKRKKSRTELKVIEFPLVVKFSTAWQMRDKGGI